MLVMVADQNAALREEIRKLLTSVISHIGLMEVAKADEIIPCLRRQAFRYVILGCSIVDPQLISQICHLDQRTRVIVVGRDNPEFGQAVLAQGASAYLPLADLPAALRRSESGPSDTAGNPAAAAKTTMIQTKGGPMPSPFFNERAANDLSPRQVEVLRLMAGGMSNQDIADHLNIQVGTVKVHLSTIYRIMGVKNRTQAVVAAEHLGLLSPP